MQKKACLAVLLLILLAAPVSADFESFINSAAEFLKGDRLTGFVTASASQSIPAADTTKVARSGKWEQSGTGENSAVITSALDSTLTFSFTGTGLGVIVYRNDGLKATISVDGHAYDIDTSRMSSSNCWNSNKDYCEIPIASGLSNSQHTAVLKTASGTGHFHAHKFLINTGTPAPPSTTSCDDKDGQNFYAKGTVYSSSYQSEGGARTDACSGEKTVVEQICSGNTPSSIRYECPTKCSDGACTEADSCTAYLVKYNDGKRSADSSGVDGYDTVAYGPVCKNGEYYWCTTASQNSNCYGCYTGNLCNTGTQCQASPYFDYNSNGIVDDSDVSLCNECIGRYSSGTCSRCDFNGDCAVTLTDVGIQKGKKTLGCDSSEIKNARYIDGARTDRQDGVLGYDTVTYGPVCKNNAKYWCTQSSKNPACFGCYTGNMCDESTNPLKPDLTIEDIRLSPIALNQDLDLAVVFKNKGSAATRILDYEISAGAKAAVSSSTFDGDLIPGESATVYAKVRYGTAGTARITAKVDKNSRVDELNENNNELSKDFTINAAQEPAKPEPESNCNKLHAECTITESDRIAVKVKPVDGATSYLLEWRKSGTDKWVGCSDANECGSTRNPKTEILAIGLDTYTTYQLRVRIESGKCAGASSDIFYCITKEDVSGLTNPSCSELAATPYSDGIANTISGEAKYGHDTIVQPADCQNGVVRWCTRSSKNSECENCDTGSCCGGTKFLTRCTEKKCSDGVETWECSNPNYPRCRQSFTGNKCGDNGENSPPVPPGSSLPSPDSGSGKCQQGIRKEGEYCDQNGIYRKQKQDSQACDNSFECATNSCTSGKCIDLEKQLREQRSLLERILSFLRRDSS